MSREEEPQRQIPLVGQNNFRDLGGYETADGRRVKWRHLYRSGDLSELTDGDVESLAALGIRTVVDLRGEVEAEKKGPDRLPRGAALASIAIEPGDLSPILGPAFATGDFSTIPEDLLLQINRQYIRDWRHRLDSLLRLAAEPAGRPLVFHCSHGKDRAGIGAALLLSALGVPWDSVMEDYLLSNHQRREQVDLGLSSMRESAARKRGIAAHEVDLTNILGLFLVHPSYLGAAHAEIISLYGSVQAFICDGIGWSDSDLQLLRDGLLE
ncbi:MAG: hypothetical protein CL910_16990 [Deltaproteobacteria bacterium]|nr:hypothetical protein [Deltaproteobacteria bacterium]